MLLLPVVRVLGLAKVCKHPPRTCALQSGENEDELMDRETQLQLIAMGIPSPVTKESAGKVVAM